MSQGRVAYRWTAADLDRLPDDPLLRYEIIDGELIVSRCPHLQHSEILVRLVSWPHPVVQACGGKVLAGPGIVWGEEAEDNVIPDIAVVVPNRLHLTHGSALSGTPNMAIEIVSESSVTTDYVQKRYLDERTGADEYGIVDRFARRLQVWQFIGERATSVSYGDADILTTAARLEHPGMRRLAVSHLSLRAYRSGAMPAHPVLLGNWATAVPWADKAPSWFSATRAHST